MKLEVIFMNFCTHEIIRLGLFMFFFFSFDTLKIQVMIKKREPKTCEH